MTDAVKVIDGAIAARNVEPIFVDEIAEQQGVDPAITDAYMQGYHDAGSRKVALEESDPRDDFEAEFPMPKNVERCGSGYWLQSILNGVRMILNIGGMAGTPAAPPCFRLATLR